MARIAAAVPLDETELANLPAGERVNKQTQAIFAHRPDHAGAVFGLMETCEYGGGTLDDRLIELVRLRIAFWNQCRSCMSLRYKPDAVSEDLVCSLERPEEADDLSDAEKAALSFADMMATDHLAIDDSVYEDLRRHFSEGELVELGIVCAGYVGFGRLAATWAMHEHLHESFRGEEQAEFVPWGEGALR
jgi:alkylhydroperoxidase family enzyme